MDQFSNGTLPLKILHSIRSIILFRWKKVPSQQGKGGEQKLALCSIYLLFGIAMIAMSFNLVQEQVINNVKELGRQCGILKDEEDDDDY